MGRYKLRIKPSAVREIEHIPRKSDRRRIVACIESLGADPRPPGCEKLAGQEERYRLRQGPYRVVYRVDDRAHTVIIFKIGHRREVYREPRLCAAAPWA